MLDVGFGGYGAEILTGSVGEYVGLDLSGDAVQHASSRYTFPNVRFEQPDAATIPFDAGSFDLVISFHVLEHRGTNQSVEAGLSLADVRCVDSGVDESVHLVAVIDRKDADPSGD